LNKWVYAFGNGTADGSADMGSLLGGKGANLAEMSALGLPVPPGFTLTTEVCNHFTSHEDTYPEELAGAVSAGLQAIEDAIGAKFGDAANPLLVSVRSGARASMPGMMDTVLNLGLNDETVKGLAAAAGDERFAYDSYRRFIQMYADVVLGVGHHHFEDILALAKEDKDLALDTDLDADDWKAICAAFKAKVEAELGATFPQDPKDQLWGAIGAVFGSWMNERAIIYRRLHDIPGSWGTAVNVQSMVFGNMGDRSATGVCFTRNPSTGENAFYGEYLINAQGEDVVAGIRTPMPLTIAEAEAGHSRLPSMEESLPAMFGELSDVREILERHYKDMQDMEFTVQEGKLWMLQTRSGKRTAKAALKIAVEMVADGLVSREEAIQRIDPAPGQSEHLDIHVGSRCRQRIDKVSRTIACRIRIKKDVRQRCVCRLCNDEVRLVYRRIVERIPTLETNRMLSGFQGTQRIFNDSLKMIDQRGKELRDRDHLGIVNPEFDLMPCLASDVDTTLI